MKGVKKMESVFEKLVLVMNESHKLLPQQEKLLLAAGWTGEKLLAPANGWTLDAIRHILDRLPAGVCLVFLSPIPAMMVLAANRAYITIAAFHNDRREAKEEIVNGQKVVRHVLHPDGWQIVF